MTETSLSLSTEEIVKDVDISLFDKKAFVLISIIGGKKAFCVIFLA